MNNIIEPISKYKLAKELANIQLLRNTVKGDNEIYTFTFREAPNVMYEVGRLREISFRSINCGSGNIIDLDSHDIDQPVYQQLIVWNPREQEIVGGYRYAICSGYQGQLEKLSMSNYFNFSQKFLEHYLPYSVELGRAWINPDYQSNSYVRKSIFALDNLWDGIGAIINQNDQLKYLFGKITIPESYNPVARMLLLWILNHYHRDSKCLVIPAKPIISPNILSISGCPLSGNDFENDYNSISRYIRNHGLMIPPLISAYVGLSSKMTIFGTTINPELNYAFETGMLIAIKDIYPEKYERYVKERSKKGILVA